MAGFLQRLGLVEEVPQTRKEVTTDEAYETEYEETEPTAEANLNGVNTDTLIDDIYMQNGLYDKSRSIFKVEELSGNLPKEMTTDSKRSTVLSVLSTFGLTVMEVKDDGEKRIAILKSINDQISSEAKTIIEDKSNQIEDHKKAIAALEKEIADERSRHKVSNEIITTEVSRIDDLVNFLEVGGNE